MERVSIQLTDGPIQAALEDGLVQARGIPFATARRFEPPVPVTPWQEALNATEHGPACPQLPFRLEFVLGPMPESVQYSEDCLNLTVTAPVSDGRTRPVMVWIHGGAYISGAGSLDIYQPDQLVREGEVVVVRINYRLGIFGQLAIPGISPANLGLLDQLEALRWVQRNIAAFGGDPDNVTIFGQSAGGDSVLQLLVAEGNEGLFTRAIMQSAPLAVGSGAQTVSLGISTGRSEMYAAMGKAAAAVLGASPGEASTDEVLAAQQAAAEVAPSFGTVLAGMPFGPQAGATPLPPEVDLVDRRLEAARFDLMIGWTRDDAMPFVEMNPKVDALRKAPFAGPTVEKLIADAATHLQMAKPAQAVAERHRERGGKAVVYRFDWRPSGSRFLASHCVELPLLMGTEAAWRVAPLIGDAEWDAIVELGRPFRAHWYRFARGGVAAVGADAEVQHWP